MGGSEVRSEVGEKNEFPTLWNYLYAAVWGTGGSTYGPTPTHQKSLANAEQLCNQLSEELGLILGDFDKIYRQMKAIGAPMIKE